MAQSITNLPIGAKVCFGSHSVNGETATPITWLIVAKNHYGNNEITLLSEKVIDFRCYDAKEPNNTDANRQSYGNNRYDVSNIHQWLNSDSGEGEWYVAQHSADQSPDSNDVLSGVTPYASRPGFLYNFTEAERSMFAQSPVIVGLSTVDGGGTTSITPKVFLPSARELDNSFTVGENDGTIWEYFNNIAAEDRVVARSAYATQSAITNSTSNYKPDNTGTVWSWWTRTPYIADSCYNYFITIENQFNIYYSVDTGVVGVRPATNILNSVMVSDTVDSSGAYSVELAKPPTPASVSVGDVIVDYPTSAKVTVVSYTDLMEVSYYEIEAKTPTSDWVVVATAVPPSNISSSSTASDSTQFTLTSEQINEGDQIQFRARAFDANGRYSDYSETTISTAVYNASDKPTIIYDTTLVSGTKKEGFSFTITFDTSIIVREYSAKFFQMIVRLDDTIFFNETVTLPVDERSTYTYTIDISGETWLKLSNGTHKLTLYANRYSNSGSNYVTEISEYFVKAVDTVTVSNSAIMVSATRPTRISLNMSYAKPTTSILTVEVCNNAYDTSPVWEDATYAVLGNFAHVFTNNVCTSGTWGIKFRVSLSRNGATGDCYISSIGGNWE